MDCKGCVENLTAYQDGELNPSESGELEAHLGICADCRREFATLEQASHLVASQLHEIEPSPEIWDGVFAKVSALPASPRSAGLLQFFVAHRWTAAAATVASSLVMAAGAWGLWSHRQSELAFRRYMDDYVQLRTLQEQTRPVALTNANVNTAGTVEVNSEYADNPFADLDVQEIDNPFRLEEQ